VDFEYVIANYSLDLGEEIAEAKKVTPAE